jgi:signal transduction histidine kinase
MTSPDLWEDVDWSASGGRSGRASPGVVLFDRDRIPGWEGAALRLLLVEDDEVDRMAVRRALAGAATVELTELEDARAALDALSREEFDCALIDYRLPGKDDGLAILRAARKLGIRTPVVVLTAHGDEETAVEMMKAGASDYIPKAAFSAERIFQSVKNAIRLRRAELEIERTQLELREAITREQAARADAVLQRERLRSLFLQAPALINVHHGPDHIFEIVHPLTRQLFGNRPLEGRPLRTALPELEGQGFFEAFDRVFATGETSFRRDAHFKIERGAPGRWDDAYFNFVYQPLRDSNGTVEGVIAVGVEVTEMVLSRQRAELLLAELQTAVRTREDLLAIVSHDLRNPLGAIIASAQQLAKADTPAKLAAARAHGDRISRSAGRMNRLIAGLLDLAQVDSRTLSLFPEMHSLRALVEESVELMRSAAQDKQLRLESDIPSDLTLWCDRERLHQILSNLLGNAIKFSPDGGTVTVRAVADESGIHCSVSDTGVGIGPDDLPHIFDRYWRAQVRKESGVGLGLSIVKGLVEAHRGTVWAESDIGKGTTIHFVLPPQKASLRDPDHSQSSSKAAVLIVDDDLDIRTTIADILTDAGYVVETAANGREALDHLSQSEQQPGLILLDMMMPVMDGSAFRAEQERDPRLRAIPVVVFSAYGNVARIAESLHAAGHLKKPLRAEMLLETVARLTGGRAESNSAVT